jgi:hypothetical protein
MDINLMIFYVWSSESDFKSTRSCYEFHILADELSNIITVRQLKRHKMVWKCFDQFFERAHTSSVATQLAATR